MGWRLINAFFFGSLQIGYAHIKYMTWDGCTQKPGNFHNGTVRGRALDSTLDLAAVRCCKDTTTGLTCETDVNTLCNSGKSWSEAKQICESNGHRLCTLTELQSNVCCGTGCQFDYMTPIWTSTKAEKYATRAPCPTGTTPGTDPATWINYTVSGVTGKGIALCYSNGQTPSWKECKPDLMMIGEAFKCCLDLPGTWRVPIMSDFDGLQCQPGILTDQTKLVWTDATYKYNGWIAADGCSIRNYGSNSTQYAADDYYYNTFEKHAVRCCSYDGGKCVTTTRFGCESSVSWHEALEACHEMDMRLCRAHDIRAHKCCVTGCMFDVDRVWTSTLDINYRSVYKNLTGPDNCKYGGDVSAGTTVKYGTVCCGPSSTCVEPVPGTCTMDTPGDAQRRCDSLGLEVCRDSRLCSRCKSTACYQSSTPMIAFKTYLS